MHHIVYYWYSQDLKSRNLMYILPSFAHLSPVLSGLNRVKPTGLGKTSLTRVKCQPCKGLVLLSFIIASNKYLADRSLGLFISTIR